MDSFRVNQAVEHARRGTGRVVEIKPGDLLIVKFDSGETHRYRDASIASGKIVPVADLAGPAALVAGAKMLLHQACEPSYGGFDFPLPVYCPKRKGGLFRKGGHAIREPVKLTASPLRLPPPCGGGCEAFCTPGEMVWHCAKCNWYCCNGCAHMQMP